MTEEKLPYWVQPEDRKKIADKIWTNFVKYRNNRNKAFPQFRGRTLIEYINDSNAAFNNYKLKPSWKDDWQANISDITTHAKLMAIVAQIIAIRLRPEFFSLYNQDFYSKFRARLIQDLFDWTETAMRNGDLDMLFTVLRAAREGTCIGFEGWKKTKTYEGIDAQFIPLEDFYPQNIAKFRMEDQLKCIWRTVMTKDEADDYFLNNPQFENYDKVRVGQNLTSQDRAHFNVSEDIQEDFVEILRWFNKLDDEFHITINGVLITKPGSKLSQRRKDRELGFWKAVYEPFGDDFFYGRSFPDLLKDNQDAIDYLFNAMFDREMISLLRPIFVGGTNQLADDYFYPARLIQVGDVSQIKESIINGPDEVSFSLLQTLMNRQHSISVDTIIQGLATGRKTAHEVERAQEGAKRILGLFMTTIQDAIRFKALLRGATILQYLVKKEWVKPIVIHNVKLSSGNIGMRILRIKPKSKIAGRNIFGYSPQLAMENALIPEESEIIEFSPEAIKDFEFGVGVRIPSSVEMSSALKKLYDKEFATIALSRPDLYKSKVVARNLAEAFEQDPEEVINTEEESPNPLEDIISPKEATPRLGSTVRPQITTKPLKSQILESGL